MSNQVDEVETTGLEPLDYENVLISVANPETAKQLVRLAYLATTHRATFHIMNVTLQKSFPEKEKSWRRGTDLVLDSTHYARRLGRVAKPLAATAKSIPRSIVNAASEVDADLVIMGWFGRITPVAVRRSSVVNKVLHNAPCDVAVLKSRNDLAEVEDVVIPVGAKKPRYKRLALADSILKQSGANGELAHILTGDKKEWDEEDAEDYLEEIRALLTSNPDTRLIHSNSILNGLLNATRDADMVIIGPGREWVFDRFLFGRTADNLTNRIDGSVVMFKGSEHAMVAWSRGFLKAIKDLVTGSF